MIGPYTSELVHGHGATRFIPAFFVEVAPDDYHLTTDAAAATHGLIDTSGAGDWQIVPLASLDGSARLVARPDGTFIGY